MFQINGFYLAASLNAMAEQMVGRCVTIMDKRLNKCFTFLIHISVIHRSFCCFTFVFQIFLNKFCVCVFFSVHVLHIGISTIGLSLWLHLFVREGSYAHS